jgi:phosphatidylserine/phosphatidylglycerophosphate/cardiolipin synthase-like enzyme
MSKIYIKYILNIFRSRHKSRDMQSDFFISDNEKGDKDNRNSFFEMIKTQYNNLKEKFKNKDSGNIFKKIFNNNLPRKSEFMNLKINQKKFSEENRMTCQIVRSACNWSVGLQKTERSILEAYYDLIDNAKHYILIENQFFISKTFTDDEYHNAGGKGQYIIENE